MNAYAIRHKATGKYMPCRMTRCGFGGWSWWVPTSQKPNDKPFDEHPRIFWTEQAARNALTAWLQGAWRQEERSEGWESPETYTELVPEAPPEPRAREDMEIVALQVAGL